MSACGVINQDKTRDTKTEKQSSLYYTEKLDEIIERTGGVMMHISTRIPVAWQKAHKTHNGEPLVTI